MEDLEDKDPIEEFIHRWQDISGLERANYQLFLTELCTLLGLKTPDPSSALTAENAYTFERRVTFQNRDGSERPGYIDLYKRVVVNPFRTLC